MVNYEAPGVLELVLRCMRTPDWTCMFIDYS
jgi:hypothetical protein